MIQVVITKSGNKKGYLLEDTYIPYKLLKFFTSDTNLKGTRVISEIYKNGIKVRGKKYTNILGLMSKQNYRQALRTFIINGISLNQYLFLPINLSDISTEKVSIFWGTLKDLPLKNFYLYLIVDSNFEEIGYIFSRSNLYQCSTFYINMIEIFDKNKGKGTEVINLLKSMNLTISGLALCQARKFWSNLGAEFLDNNNHFVI